MSAAGPAAATAEVLVEASPEEAFAIFTDEIALWWRTDTPYWNDRERARSVRIEPGMGGRFIEVYDLETGAGFEVGRVTAWEPGRRLALTWTQIGWPEGVATDVDVTFEPVGEGTRVRLEQTGFERVPGAETSIGGYDCGWKEVLGWFAERTNARGTTTGARTREGADHGNRHHEHDRLVRAARLPGRGVEVSTKYVLLYESAENVAEKAPAHYPAHSQRLQQFHRDGTLLMVGTFGDPQNEGSMAIFTTREAVEEFIAEDPFVLNGVVRGWQIREWDEALCS